MYFRALTLLHSEWSTLYGVLAILSAVGLSIPLIQGEYLSFGHVNGVVSRLITREL